MSHPSDDIASNLDALFTSPTVGDEDKQLRVDAIVAAAKVFAQAVVDDLTEPSGDRQEALVAVRTACDRAVSAITYEVVLISDPPEEGPEP